MMTNYRIASIPADGIGPEVICSRAAGAGGTLATRDGGFSLRCNRVRLELRARYKTLGALMPEDGTDQLKAFDAIFFGAVGAPDVPGSHVSLWGFEACRSARVSTNTPMCARPGSCRGSRRNAGTGVGPGDLDWVIVRENSEG